MTGVLVVKVYARNNHGLLLYDDNGFYNTIITLLILLHITMGYYSRGGGSNLVMVQPSC